MSKVASTIEMAIVCLAIVGIALRLTHIPGGAMLSILSLGSLGMFYFFAGYLLFDPTFQTAIDGFQFRKTNAKRALLAIATGIMLSIVLIGVLFKLMHWPGALAQTFIAFVTVTPIFVIGIVKYRATKSGFYRRVVIRTAIAAIVTLAILAKMLITIKYR